MAFFAKDKVGQVRLVEATEIVSNPYQPRKQFSEVHLKELAESIKTNGLLQPITVRRVGEGYEIIAGERRLMACRMIGMERVPVLVEQCSDDQSAIFALIENLQRQDLNCFEQAEGMLRLMRQCHLTQEQLAKQLGKAQPTIANKMRLLVFPENLRQQILSAGLTERHARALLKIPQTEWQNAIEVIASRHMNVNDTEKYLIYCQKSDTEKKKGKKLFLLRDFRIFKNTIEHAISTMKLAGVYVESVEKEDEEYLLYTMRIAKKSVYRTNTA